MNQLNLNTDPEKGGKKEKAGQEVPLTADPQDAMSVAVSSLVSMASRLGQMTEILADMQTLMFDMRSYLKEMGLDQGFLNPEKVEEIENENGDDDDG